MNTPQALTRLRRLDLMKTRVRKLSDPLLEETRSHNFRVRRNMEITRSHMEIMRDQIDEQNRILRSLVSALREKKQAK